MKDWLRNEGWVVPPKGKIHAKTSQGYFSRLDRTAKSQYVARKILKFLISQRKLRHNRTWRDRLRIAKVLEVPFPIRTSIAHKGQIRPDRTACTMNSVTPRATKIGN